MDAPHHNMASCMKGSPKFASYGYSFYSEQASNFLERVWPDSDSAAENAAIEYANIVRTKVHDFWIDNLLPALYSYTD